MGLSSWMMSARRQHPQLRRCALADLRRCARGVGGAARKARGGPGRGESGELVPAPCSSSARRGSRMAAGGLRPVRCSSSARRGGARCCCSTSSSSAWPVVTDGTVTGRLGEVLELRTTTVPGRRRARAMPGRCHWSITSSRSPRDLAGTARPPMRLSEVLELRITEGDRSATSRRPLLGSAPPWCPRSLGVDVLGLGQA